VIGLLVVSAAAVALGAGLVSRAGAAGTRLALLALAFPAGIASLAIAALGLCALGVQLSRGLVLALCSAALVAGAWLGRRGPGDWGWPRARSPLERYAVATTLAAAALVFTASLTVPLVSVDARILWTYHARLIADAGGYPAPELRDARFLIAHAAYPPLLPMAEALTAVVAGAAADERALRSVPTLFAFALVALLFAELPRRDARLGLLLAASFALMPTLISFEEGGADAGVADATLACFVLASVVALDAGSPLLAGLLAGAAALTKNEGALLGLLVCVSGWLPRRRPRRASATASGAFAALVAAGALLRTGLAASVDEHYLGRLGRGAFTAGLQRGPELLLEMLKTTLLLPHRGGLLPLLVLLFWAASERRRMILLEGRLWILPAFFASVWALYVISPWPGVVQVQLSFPRLLLQVTPLALYALTQPARDVAPSR
jgi:hypothetical protein